MVVLFSSLVFAQGLVPPGNGGNYTTYQNNSYYNITNNFIGGNASWNQTFANTLYIEQSDESNLNVNSSYWWAGLTGWVSDWFFNDGAIFTFNETKLNLTIDARASGSGVGNASWNQTYASELYIPIQANLTQSSGNSIAGWVNKTFVIVGRN